MDSIDDMHNPSPIIAYNHKPTDLHQKLAESMYEMYIFIFFLLNMQLVCW